MPLYEYECTQCGKKFEKLVSISAANHKQKCPECGNEDSRKLFSTFATKSSGSGASSGPPAGSKFT